MGQERYSNAVATTLNGAINNTTTSVVLTNASSFPTQYFRIVIESEIMFCTSRSGNTLTVLRGQEGTTAASHADTTPVIYSLTAGMLDNYRRDTLAMCGLIDPSDSLSTDDDYFDDESFSGSWTTVQGTPNVTVTEKNHRASVLIPGGSAAAQQYAFMKAKTPSANGYIQAGFQYGGGSGQYPHAHLWMADGVTYNSGKQVGFGFSINENTFILRSMTGYNAQVATGSFIAQNSYFWPTLHLRMAWTSNDHYTCYTSPDCISWTKVYDNSNIGTLGAAPTYMGWGATSWGSSNPFVISCLYCRYSF